MILCVFPIFCPNPLEIVKSSTKFIEYSAFWYVLIPLLDTENAENPKIVTKNKEKNLEFKWLVAHSKGPSDGYRVTI